MTDQQVFVRALPAMLEQRSPELLTGRLVPYGVTSQVLDMLPTGPDIYHEGFKREAFDGQVNNSRGNPRVLTKIGFVHRHEGGLGYLGPFTALRSEADGLYGDARILPTKADDVAALLDAGVTELSVEFRLRGKQNTTVDENGVRWRTAVHLDQVALEPSGAYSQAEVLAFRAEMDELAAEEAAEAASKSAEELAAEEAAQHDADVQAELEKRAEAAMERRARFEELAAKTEAATAKQRQLIEDYGLVIPRQFSAGS